MNNYYRIILKTKDVFVIAESKGFSTQVAIEQKKLDRFDLYDIEDILEITEIDYLRGIGQRR
mgnify:CR=1 FL=1